MPDSDTKSNEDQLSDVPRRTRMGVPVLDQSVITGTHRRATADDLGRMSAQAVLAQYEAAAKSVESMGDEVKVRVAKLEAALQECDADMQLLAEAANAIREKGKLVYIQIDEASDVSKDIRAACAEFRKKIVGNGGNSDEDKSSAAQG
jgi:uncharacterized protein YfcZ (UPF0381/DUF406 family)